MKLKTAREIVSELTDAQKEAISIVIKNSNENKLRSTATSEDVWSPLPNKQMAQEADWAEQSVLNRIAKLFK